MIFISHDLAVVQGIADRVLVMRRGYLLEAGSRAQIFQETAHPYTKSLLGAVPTLSTDRNRPLATVAGSLEAIRASWSSAVAGTGFARNLAADDPPGCRLPADPFGIHGDCL